MVYLMFSTIASEAIGKKKARSNGMLLKLVQEVLLTFFI